MIGKEFLPVTLEECRERGWDRPDFVYVTGDAYVDHPSFGTAIISRLLEAHGYKVGIIAQPDWKDNKSIQILGRPRLGFLVSAGNMDSMVNHYSVSKKRRKEDSYTPGGVMGKRPDYAVVVYCNLIRSAYKDVPIIFLTALDDTQSIVKGFQLGANDFISKPFRKEELMVRICHQLSLVAAKRIILQQTEELKKMIAGRDKLYSVIAHDLRSPMASMTRFKFTPSKVTLVMPAFVVPS